MSEIKACVFDAYGTLFDVHSASRRIAERIPDAERLSAIWRDRQLQYTWLRALMKRYADFWQVIQDSLDYAMAACALDDPDLRETLLGLFERLEVYPEVPSVLDAIRAAGVKTAILSNGSPTMLNRAIESADVAHEFDAVLSVDSLRTFKPDPSVYALASDALGAPLYRMAFMTSNAWDAHGAANAGFRVVWINRGDQPRERLPGHLHAELENLSGLPAALGLHPSAD